MTDTMFSLADKLIHHKEVKDKLAADTTANNAAIKQLEEWLATELVNAGIDGFTMNGKKLSYSTTLYPGPNKYRKEDLYDWLTNNGFEHMVEPKVNPQSFGALIRELMRNNNNELPEDLVDLVSVYEKPSIRVTKA